MEYGTSKDLGVSTSPKNIQGNGQFALEDLNPGTTIYYRIVRAGGGSNSRGSIKTFKTEGLTVVIKVVDRNNNPVRNQKVTLFSDPITTTTDDEGVATFEGVSPGEHEIAFNSDGEGERQTITVANNVESKIAQVNGESQVTESAAPQHFSVTYAGAGNNALIWYSTIIGLIALVIVGVVLFLKRRSGRGIGLNKFPPAGDSPQKAPVVGGTDKKTLDMLNKVQGEKPKEPGSVISPGGSNQNQNE